MGRESGDRKLRDEDIVLRLIGDHHTDSNDLSVSCS